MAYTKTTWVDGTTPAINSTNLNKIENGIYNNDSHIGNVANLNTTNKDDLVSAVNEVFQRHIITGTIANDVTLSSNSDTPLTLIQSEKVGTKLSISNGNIVCGNGVRKILISGKGQFSSLVNSTSNRYYKIKVDGTEIAVARITAPPNSTGLTLTLPPQLISVGNGTTISISTQGAIGDIFRSTSVWTIITAEVIEWE